MARSGSRRIGTGHADGEHGAMSEYQYYEFQAIDRPLSEREGRALRACSTRATITSTRFVNHYEWGDLKGDPRVWMEKYFDAFLYVANWGTHWLMLRFPRRVLELRTAKSYCRGKSATATAKGDFVILSFDSEDESGDGWDDDGTGWLSSLIPLRADIAAGDYRRATRPLGCRVARGREVGPAGALRWRRFSGSARRAATSVSGQRERCARAKPRTASQLLSAAKRHAAERRRREAERAAAERVRRERAEAGTPPERSRRAKGAGRRGEATHQSPAGRAQREGDLRRTASEGWPAPHSFAR